MHCYCLVILKAAIQPFALRIPEVWWEYKIEQADKELLKIK
jgi:hypothetical protein